MDRDYDTVGDFYHQLGEDLRRLVEVEGEDAVFCGDPELQLSQAEATLELLGRQGVPNFFGEQRFGNRGNSVGGNRQSLSNRFDSRIGG